MSHLSLDCATTAAATQPIVGRYPLPPLLSSRKDQENGGVAKQKVTTVGIPIITQRSVSDPFILSIPHSLMPLTPRMPLQPIQKQPSEVVAAPKTIIPEEDLPAFVNQVEFAEMITFAALLQKRYEDITATETENKFLDFFDAHSARCKQIVVQHRQDRKLKNLCIRYLSFASDENTDHTNDSLIVRYQFIKEYFNLFATFGVAHDGRVSVQGEILGDLRISILVHMISKIMAAHWSQQIPTEGMKIDGAIVVLQHKTVRIIYPTREIGSGSFATVHRAYEFFTQQFYALKTRNSFTKEADLKKRNELLEYASHEISNECRMLQLLAEKMTPDQQQFFMEAPSLIIRGWGYLGKLYTCDLLKLGNEEEIPPSAALAFCKQIVEGTCLLHRLGVWYRDIKLENILLDKSGMLPKARIADLGGARMLRDLTQKDFSYPTYNHDTINANENDILVLEQDIIASKNCAEAEKDFTKCLLMAEKQTVFALGVTCYRLLTREFPYVVMTNRKLGRLPRLDFVACLERAGYQKNQSLITALAGMTELDAAERWTIEQVESAFKEIGKTVALPSLPTK